MLAFLLALGLWPLIVIAATSVILLAFLENDEPAGATITALIGGAVLLLITKTNPLPWLAANAVTFLLFVLAYVAIGIVYSFPKWYFHLLRERDRFSERLEEIEDAEDRDRELRFYQRPLAKENKGRIIGWMTYWPWSAFWMLLNDPIRRLYRTIYARLAGAYEKISNSVFGQLDTDVAAAKARHAAGKDARFGRND